MTTSEGENNSLQTNDLYYVSYYEPVTEDIEVDTQEELITGSKSQAESKNII